jgi:hypothetical protein
LFENNIYYSTSCYTTDTQHRIILKIKILIVILQPVLEKHIYLKHCFSII